MILKKMRSTKEKAIWIFAGGPMQELTAKKIIQMGFKLLITDRDPDCICSKYADELVELDTFDIEGNINAATNLGKNLKIKAVISPAADCHETVAHVGKFLRLHAISPETSHICRYKHLTREVLSMANVPQPRFRSVSNIDEARRFIEEIGGEGVIKATNNSGSRGFSAIRNTDDLTDEVFERAISEGTTGHAVVEELLYPVDNEIAEQSVETVWYNGKMYWLNWVDRLFRKDFLLFDGLSSGIYSDVSWGVEIGHINPAIHEYETRNAVFDLIYRAGVAIGMKKEKGGHILKADIMLTKKGPYIIELTPRLSGGWDSSGSTPLRGADFAGGAINLALGKRLDIELWHRYFEYKNPNVYASVLASIEEGAKDCIGRKFVIGTDYDREKSIKKALVNLTEGKYDIPMVQ